MSIGSKENHCSALCEKGCSNGHTVTQGCYGVGYPTGEVVPLCVREDKLFDEEKKAVTLRDWK